MKIRLVGKAKAIFILITVCVLKILMTSRVMAAEGTEYIRSLEDFKGKKISMLSGTAFDSYMENNEILKGDVEVLYQNSLVDSLSSVILGKCDAVILDLPVAEMAVREHEELTIFPECVKDDAYGFGFTKGSEVEEPFNAAMKKLVDEGLKAEMAEKWMGKDESVKVTIPQDWDGTKGTLRYWVNVGAPPMSYLGPDGTHIGYSIDFVLHVAREMNYRVEITECEFAGLIPALQSGKADIAGTSLSITEERREKIDFSDSFYDGGAFMVLRKDRIDPMFFAEAEAPEKVNDADTFFSSIRNSFKKTFLQDNRWRVFLKGFLNTLLINITSMLTGCLFGFALFYMCRKTGEAVLKAVKFVTGLIVGIPVVVLLMVIYYVVFGNNDISGIIVSIMAFTLTFGTSVFHMLQVGTGAVGQGQTEGAYALGFSDEETFFSVVFPQAIIHMLPIFKGELVALLKSTAVVGYIAVQDLTRSGDMIRNRTFDAFFSLISVAVIYYVLGRLMGCIIGKIQTWLDPTCRTADEILKGVKTDV